MDCMLATAQKTLDSLERKIEALPAYENNSLEWHMQYEEVRSDIALLNQIFNQSRTGLVHLKERYNGLMDRLRAGGNSHV